VGDTDGNNGRGVVAADDGIAIGQAELCHIRPDSSSIPPAATAIRTRRSCRTMSDIWSFNSFNGESIVAERGR